MWDEFFQGVNDNYKLSSPIWLEWLTKNIDDEEKEWRRKHIPKNNRLYEKNKEFIDYWIKKYDNLEWCYPAHKRLEWQTQGKISSIWDGLIQFRASGVRVKPPYCYPTLTASNSVPLVIGKYKRKLTPRECARLQDFPEDFIINKTESQAYKQFGNAVNVKVIKECAKKLFNYKEEITLDNYWS